MTRKRTTENDLLASAAPASTRRKPAARTRSRRTAPPVEGAAVPAVEPAPVTLEAAAAAQPEPTYEDIARLAYTYWEARGCQGGTPDEDWLRAEQELRTGAVAATA